MFTCARFSLYVKTLARDNGVVVSQVCELPLRLDNSMQLYF